MLLLYPANDYFRNMDNKDFISLFQLIENPHTDMWILYVSEDYLI